MRRPVRNAFLLGILVGLVAALVRALRADGSGPGAVGAGPPPLPRATDAPAPVEGRVTATAAPTPSPVATGPVPSPEAPAPTPAPDPDPPADVVAPVAADPVPDVPATARPEVGSEATAWEEPVGGACPEGFPVKVKEASGIFHVPEGAFYERTVPDRCYPTAAAAEADGFRASKR